MVIWLRVEARFQENQIQFPVPVVISDLLGVYHSSQPGPCGAGVQLPEVHFAYPTCCLKIPSVSSQSVADSGEHGYRLSLSALKDKTRWLNRVYFGIYRQKSCNRRLLFTQIQVLFDIEDFFPGLRWCVISSSECAIIRCPRFYKVQDLLLMRSINDKQLRHPC